MLGGSLGLPPAWSQHEAAAQEVEARPTKHLAFQHFQPVNVPLDGTRTPGQGDSRFHRFVILVQPGSEALYGVHGTRGGAREPGIEALRLQWADEGGKVLRQVDG